MEESQNWRENEKNQVSRKTETQKTEEKSHERERRKNWGEAIKTNKKKTEQTQ